MMKLFDDEVNVLSFMSCVVGERVNVKRMTWRGDGPMWLSQTIEFVTGCM